jgi:hypothetical protein
VRRGVVGDLDGDRVGAQARRGEEFTRRRQVAPRGQRHVNKDGRPPALAARLTARQGTLTVNQAQAFRQSGIGNSFHS